MSLFQAREWWSYAPDDETSTDENNVLSSVSVTVSPFPTATGSQADVIVTGSLSGFIRIFAPFENEDDLGAEQGSRKSSPANLLLEMQLGEPILQICVGKLTQATSGDKKLLVLHPRLVSIYSLEVQKGKTMESHGFSLQLQYQHKLSRSAFSAVVGPFGQGRKDFICVQSIDGTLNLFEQESYAFSRFLPGFLLPGPVVYCERTDSFITVTAAMQMESYRYNALAVAGEEPKSRTNDEITTGKRLNPDWTLGLGEEASSLQVLASKEKDYPSTIIFLGWRLFCAVLDTGVIRFMKKLDYVPVSIHSYMSTWTENRVMTLVASDSKTLLVYENTNLKWASQMPFTPSSLGRGSFRKSSGTNELHQNMLVLASTEGELFVSYLGTNPTLHSVPPALARDVDYEACDQELATLSTQIKALQSSEKAGPKSQKVSDLKVEASLAGQLERCLFSTDLNRVDPEANALMCKIQVKLSCHTPLSQVRLALNTEEPLSLSQSTFTVHSLTDSSVIESYVYLKSTFIPHSLELFITVTYLTHQGTPHVVTSSLKLPLKLVLKPCSPIKDADYKVTIATNKPAVSLLDLFPDFVLDGTLANAVGFQYLAGPFVTVLSSKTSQRYRLQSDNLPAIWLLTYEIEERLKNYFKSGSNSDPLVCSYSSSFPMHEFFTEVETHFFKRNKLKELKEQLSQRSTQFRTIERRLLTRFKDKTPSPLTNLDTLLEGTFRQIMIASDAIEDCEAELQASSCNLACIVKMILLLTRLSSGLSEEEMIKLSSALTPIIHNGQEQGWEETTDAALTFLLRTSLAKPGKENQGATPITLEPPKDIIRLKKHVSSVMDRISKGAKMTENIKTGQGGSSAIMDLHEVTGIDADDEMTSREREDVPVGTKFGEAGERLRSARNRSARPGSTLAKIRENEATTHDTENAKTAADENYEDVENYIRNENEDINETNREEDDDGLADW